MKANHLVPTLAAWRRIALATAKVRLQTKLVAGDRQQADFARTAYAQEGRNALFVLPSYQ
jgi:hypothetical protein